MPATTDSTAPAERKPAVRRMRDFVPKSAIKRQLHRAGGNKPYRLQATAAQLLSAETKRYCDEVIELAVKLMRYKKRNTLTAEDIQFASDIKQGLITGPTAPDN